MHTRVQGFGGLRVDVALSHDAPERRLNVTARAAETIVEFEVPERGVEVVAPQQADHPLAEPDAFGGGGRTLQGAAGLDGLVRPRLAFGASRIGRRLLLRRLRGRLLLLLRRRLRRLLFRRLGGGRRKECGTREECCSDGGGSDARTGKRHDVL
ncbi:hypothetical protein [Rhodoplanes elegans]|uniref:hypothetical protein n=1 Tax=Rhodoplanes elegans TaxID=29408 RepID=UPI001AECC21A